MATEGRSPVAVEALTTLSAIEAIRPQWSDLWSRCRSATPFQSPDWLVPWSRHYGGGPLRVVALRRDGVLVGLLPLFLQDDPESAPHGRKLLLIGTGNTDVLDALVADRTERLVTTAFEALAARGDRWDVADLHQLPEGSPLRHEELPRGWHDEVSVQDARPVLTLPDRIEDLSRFVPPSRVKRLRDDRRRAERFGPVRIEQATGASFEECFGALLRIHQARWSARGLPGVLADGPTRFFHEESAATMLQAGRLRLYAARVGGRIVAAFHGFTDGRTMYYYLGGFDPEYRRLSLGTLLVGHAIEEAVREGCAAFDFLRGREPYKYEWGAVDRLNYRRFVRSPGGA